MWNGLCSEEPLGLADGVSAGSFSVLINLHQLLDFSGCEGAGFASAIQSHQLQSPSPAAAGSLGVVRGSKESSHIPGGLATPLPYASWLISCSDKARGTKELRMYRRG